MYPGDRLRRLSVAGANPVVAIETGFSFPGGIQVGKTMIGHDWGFGTSIKNGKVTLTGQKETCLDLGKVKGCSKVGGTLYRGSCRAPLQAIK